MAQEIVYSLYHIKISTFSLCSALLSKFNCSVQAYNDISITAIDKKSKFSQFFISVQKDPHWCISYVNFTESHITAGRDPICYNFWGVSPKHWTILSASWWQQPFGLTPHHANVSDFTSVDSNSDDDIHTLGAFLGNLGFSNEQVHKFELFLVNNSIVRLADNNCFWI